MSPATPATLDARVDADDDLRVDDVCARATPVSVRASLQISIHEDLVGIERDWRAFEQHADCTAFQSFDWLSAWQRHVGSRRGVLPAIVAVRDDAGVILMLLPLAVEPGGFLRRLTFLGSDLCDYNAPQLAANFAAHLGSSGFRGLWRDVVQRLRAHTRLSFDVVSLEKMPERVGGQDNPFLRLAVVRNANNAYATPLTGDWESFYAGKRSATTRRRDRTKRKRLAEFGQVRFVSPETADEISSGLDAMMVQKARQLARMGAPNVFARPGYRAFFRALATDPATRGFVHVSRLDVGDTVAAVNFGLMFRGSYYHVVTSHDDGELSKFGPGVAHLHDLMRYAIGRGCRVFDFTVGDERYKLDWCDGEMKLYDYTAIATWRGAPVGAGLAAARLFKRAVKRTPALWTLASAIRARLGAWRGGGSDD